MDYHFYLEHLENENRGTHAENLALFQLYRPFLLVRPAENKCVFWTFTYSFGSFRLGFRTFCRVVKTDSHIADQWAYLHKNIIFLIIILILKHVLLRLMQKYLSPVINCLACCMNWYSWGVIRSSYRIRTRSHRIRIVVKFYNHTLLLRYGCIPMRY